MKRRVWLRANSVKIRVGNLQRISFTPLTVQKMLQWDLEKVDQELSLLVLNGGL